jgi:DNA-binding response OmpR family regulator
MISPKHLLVVDHDGDTGQVVGDLLIDLGYVVTVARDAAAMRVVLDADAIDLIVLDATTLEGEAIAVATNIRDRGVRLVMISGRPELMEAYQNRTDQLLRKPFAQETLKRAVDHAFASSTFGQRKEDPD